LNRQINIKRSTFLSWLFSLMLFAPLMSAAEQDRIAALTLPELIYNSSEHFTDIDSANLDNLLQRIGDSRLVLLGEATHGTAEFYDMRARITRELIEKKGFNVIALEADWPDAESIDNYIHAKQLNPFHKQPNKNKPFTGFPSWMWANQSVLAFTNWLKDYNQHLNVAVDTVSLYGLDLYNVYSSIEQVLDYLQDVDPKAAEVARWHYACLMPWANDPSLYSRSMQSGKVRGCEYEVNAVLQALYEKRAHYIQRARQAHSYPQGRRIFSVEQNARLIRNGERYFRTMYNANNNSWNQRDQNMIETLMEILNYHGDTSKVVIWAHNSHVGDARATEMSEHGQFNLGQRVRETFGENAYLIGFGTDHGTVAAASAWGDPMKIMQIPPSHNDSYEHQFHNVKTTNYLLPLRNPINDITRKKLLKKRLQRAIGTTYYPEDELRKHYTNVSLPLQFDEYIWFDETRAVEPLSR
jgi:erythromycin esterase-like protein